LRTFNIEILRRILGPQQEKAIVSGLQKITQLQNSIGYPLRNITNKTAVFQRVKSLVDSSFEDMTPESRNTKVRIDAHC
jgi:hypothetical protein